MPVAPGQPSMIPRRTADRLHRHARSSPVREQRPSGQRHLNLLLVVKFKNNEALAPNKARYEAFMKEWGAERNKKTTETAQKDYPGMRDITGEYNMREITLTK
jgi:hypothetical protein